MWRNNSIVLLNLGCNSDIECFIPSEMIMHCNGDDSPEWGYVFLHEWYTRALSKGEHLWEFLGFPSKP